MSDNPKLNILGTEYELKRAGQKDDTRLEDNDGYCDEYAKIIGVCDDYNENFSQGTRKLDVFKKKVLRHEIIHAFLFESGLTEQGQDEELVDWLAVQFPKMLKAFQEVDAI